MSSEIQRSIRCLAAFIDERRHSASCEITVHEKDPLGIYDGYVKELRGIVSACEGIKAEMIHLGLIEEVKGEQDK